MLDVFSLNNTLPSFSHPGGAFANFSKTLLLKVATLLGLPETGKARAEESAGASTSARMAENVLTSNIVVTSHDRVGRSNK